MFKKFGYRLIDDGSVEMDSCNRDICYDLVTVLDFGAYLTAR